MGLPVLHHWYIYLPAVLIGFAVMMKPIIWAERNRKVASLLRMNVLLLAVVFVLFSFLMHSVWEVAFLVTLFFIGFNILEATLPGLISRTAPKADKGLALGIYDAELRALRRRRRGRLDRPTFFIAGRVLCIEFCYALLVPACTWPQGAQAPQTA